MNPVAPVSLAALRQNTCSRRTSASCGGGRENGGEPSLFAVEACGPPSPKHRRMKSSSVAPCSSCSTVSTTNSLVTYANPFHVIRPTTSRERADLRHIFKMVSWVLVPKGLGLCQKLKEPWSRLAPTHTVLLWSTRPELRGVLSVPSPSTSCPPPRRRTTANLSTDIADEMFVTAGVGIGAPQVRSLAAVGSCCRRDGHRSLVSADAVDEEIDARCLAAHKSRKPLDGFRSGSGNLGPGVVHERRRT